METKRAIEWVEELVNLTNSLRVSTKGIGQIGVEENEVITLLEQGEENTKIKDLIKDITKEVKELLGMLGG